MNYILSKYYIPAWWLLHYMTTTTIMSRWNYIQNWLTEVLMSLDANPFSILASDTSIRIGQNLYVLTLISYNSYWMEFQINWRNGELIKVTRKLELILGLMLILHNASKFTIRKKKPGNLYPSIWACLLSVGFRTYISHVSQDTGWFSRITPCMHHL